VHLLDAGHGGNYLPSQFDLVGYGQGKYRTPLSDEIDHGLCHLLRAMAKKHGSQPE